MSEACARKRTGPTMWRSMPWGEGYTLRRFSRRAACHDSMWRSTCHLPIWGKSVNQRQTPLVLSSPERGAAMLLQPTLRKLPMRAEARCLHARGPMWGTSICAQRHCNNQSPTENHADVAPPAMPPRAFSQHAPTI